MPFALLAMQFCDLATQYLCTTMCDHFPEGASVIHRPDLQYTTRTFGNSVLTFNFGYFTANIYCQEFAIICHKRATLIYKSVTPFTTRVLMIIIPSHINDCLV